MIPQIFLFERVFVVVLLVFRRVSICSIQHPEFSHKTYFSENALLPGLVRGEFNDERAIMAYLDDLK